MREVAVWNALVESEKWKVRSVEIMLEVKFV